MAGVTLRWQRRHFGPDSMAYDGAHLVGQVARYDTVEPGRTEVTGHFYVGFRAGERVTDRCASLEQAQRGVEATMPGEAPRHEHKGSKP